MKYIYHLYYYSQTTNNSINLKLISDSYSQAYIKAINSIFKDDLNSFNTVYSLKDYENEKSHIYIYEENNKLIGAISIYDNVINNLFVLPIYQNKGYGKKILYEAISMIDIRPIEVYILKKNIKAYNFYIHCGFVC